MVDLPSSALLLFECIGRGVRRGRLTAVWQAEGRQAETPDGTESARLEGALGG